MKIKFPKIKKDYQKENYKINVRIWWQITVGLFFILIILVSLFAYDLYVQTNKEDNTFIQRNNEKIEKEKKEKINRVLEYFAEREKKSNEILNSPTQLADPSL